MAINNEGLTGNCQYNIHAPYEQMGDEICLSRIRVITSMIYRTRNYKQLQSIIPMALPRPINT